MANKEIKINYFWPLKKVSSKDVVVSLDIALTKLSNVPLVNRVMYCESEENIQLKIIEKKENKWILGFLKNKSDAHFKNKLEDENPVAEALDDDEFIGYECVAIYDCNTNIIALQNNRNSVGAKGIGDFLNYFVENEMGGKVYLSALVYGDGYSALPAGEDVEYKSVIIGFTKVDQISELANSDNDNVDQILKIARNFGAIGGKLELTVGRSKSFLNKDSLVEFIDKLTPFKDHTKTLKVKAVAGQDEVRFIDLISNKLTSDAYITVSKDDPKTFDKIICAIDDDFESVLTNELKYCKIINNIA